MRTKDYEMFRGDTFAMRGVVHPDPLRPGDAPTDITGWTLRATVKYDLDDLDDAAIWSASTAAPGSGIAIDSAPVGAFSFVMPPDATRTIEVPGDGLTVFFDVAAADPGGNSITLEFGRIRLLPDVSRTSP